MTIEQLLRLKETEDKVEFKEAKGGNYSYSGGNKSDPKDRRRCILGYISALANEGGGYLAFGITDKEPHCVVGTKQSINEIGRLEQNIYNDLKIRIKTDELYDENEKRVLLITVPSRPIGKVITFDDIPLMRVGDELVKMSDERLFSILSEQEPDFTDKVCEGLTLNDLDNSAIDILKKLYSRKQNNQQFLTQSTKQLLSDLNLIHAGKLKYAALILLGKEVSIRKYLPQTEVRLEIRNSSTQITFDDRIIYCNPYYLMIDELWNTINLRNGKVPVQEGAYIFDIPFFNQEVIREGINNAVAHRDYKKSGEILIKQSPNELTINSPGGFPIGVNLDNLLTVNSTPRNRLLADILAKTGAVERSGQGIDKMFYQCLSEAKSPPDYSSSDNFQVSVTFSAVVHDKAFAIFIRDYQSNKNDGDKLSVFEVITLDKIRRKISKVELQLSHIQSLLERGLIERVGHTRNQNYRLSAPYYSFIGKEGIYSKETPLDLMHIQMMILAHFNNFKSAKMNDFVEILSGWFTREQIKNIIYKFTENGLLDKTGGGYNTVYKLGEKFETNLNFVGHVMQTGIEELKRRGEIN